MNSKFGCSLVLGCALLAFGIPQQAFACPKTEMIVEDTEEYEEEVPQVGQGRDQYLKSINSIFLNVIMTSPPPTVEKTKDNVQLTFLSTISICGRQETTRKVVVYRLKGDKVKSIEFISPYRVRYKFPKPIEKELLTQYEGLTQLLNY